MGAIQYFGKKMKEDYMITVQRDLSAVPNLKRTYQNQTLT